MSTFPITLKPFGPQAVLIEWPNRVEEAILKDILGFQKLLKTNSDVTENWELVPAYNSLTIVGDRPFEDFNNTKRYLKELYQGNQEEVVLDRHLWKLPVCYEDSFALDLEMVADFLKISEENVIAKHTQQAYTVYGIGFLPGFMYLGGLPESLRTPRRSAPRLKVPQGAVGLAGQQTGIYPQESPGGWNIIGNCPIPIFNVSKDDPCFVKVGDKVQFYSVPGAEHELHKIESEVGIYTIEKTSIDA